MQNIKLPIVIAVALAVGAGSFYGGMVYGQSKSSSKANGNFPNFANMTQEQRQQLRTNGSRIGAGGRGGANMIAGEVIKKDDVSATVKLPDGGSKIIIFSDKTEVMKSVEGATADIEVGKNVMVNGTTNTDGSVTAVNIQIRSDVPLMQRDEVDAGTYPPADAQPAK